MYYQLNEEGCMWYSTRMFGNPQGFPVKDYPKEDVFIETKEEGVEYTLECPGINKNNTSVEYQGRDISITSFIKSKDQNWNFRCGNGVDLDQATCTIKDGILTLIIPYKSPQENKIKKIAIK